MPVVVLELVVEIEVVAELVRQVSLVELLLAQQLENFQILVVILKSVAVVQVLTHHQMS